MDAFSLQAFSGRGWLSVAVFVVLVVIRIYKPEMIRSLTLYRWATTTFVLSILLPVGFTLFLAFFTPEIMGMGGYRRSGGMSPGYLMLATQSGSIALSISLFCFFSSLAPPVQHEFEARKKNAEPEPPRKHPLD